MSAKSFLSHVVTANVLTVLSLTLLPAAAQTPKPLKVVTLTAGINVIHAEIAAAPSEREQGLMYRQNLPANAGMLFVFEQPAEVCMWMKNTPLPLSVAFIDEQGKIINIEDMQPQTLDSHCAKRQVRYALEMNHGWFRQKNIKPDVAIDGLLKVGK